MLDEAESLGELLQCLNPISSLAQIHQSEFLTIFKDTADYIIGWLVDPTDNMEQYRELTDIMTEFHPFWLDNLSYSAQYFDDFLKDINDYTQDARKQYAEFESVERETSELDPTLLATLKKIEFLIRTYSCLMRGIGVDAFRTHPIFSDTFISKQIVAVVGIGNELLTRKRFCALQDVS